MSLSLVVWCFFFRSNYFADIFLVIKYVIHKTFQAICVKTMNNKEAIKLQVNFKRQFIKDAFRTCYRYD